MKRGWGVALAASALALLFGLGQPAFAASRATSSGIEAHGWYFGEGSSDTATFKIEFACTARGTVPLAAVGIDSCKLYRRTATGWQYLASAEPRTVPGAAVATASTYDLPMSKLAGLRVCWRDHALTVSGSQFLSASGCQTTAEIPPQV